MAYKRIYSLERGLEVLEYLNTVRAATALGIAAELKIPRPTVYRILETLEEYGLLYRSASDSVFRLTLAAGRLSKGFTDEKWIVSLGAPLLAELGKKVIWPADLATFDRDSMTIRQSTHRSSPFSIDVGMIGRRRHMLKSPLGRAYLAFCPDDEREEILAYLRRSNEPENALSHDTAFLERLFATSRANGYSTCRELSHPKCASMAVPIFHGSNVIACINIVWVASIIHYDEAIARYLPELLHTKTKVESGLKAMEEELPRVSAAAAH